MSLKNTNIAGDLVKAINSVENPKKTEATDEWGNIFNYAPLDEVVKVVKRALSKNNMAVIQSPVVNYQIYPNGFEQGVVTIKTQIVHKSGEVVEFEPVTFKANGNAPQMVGSAITYARRYSLMSIFGIAGEDDDDGRIASLHGVNTGSSNSVPENPNKKSTVVTEENIATNNENIELVSDEQRQELLELASEIAKLRNVAVDGVIGAFGGLDKLEASKFESTKNKINGWLEKAKAESEQLDDDNEIDPVEPKKNEVKVESYREAESVAKGVTKGSAIFTVTAIEDKQTKEGTDYVEISVEKTKTPMFAKPEIAKSLKVGSVFLGFYSKKGSKVTLERIEDVNEQTSLL